MCEAKTTDHDETNEHEGHAGHVDSRSADMREKEPTDNTTDDVACREGDVHVEGLKLGEACCFEEGNGVAEDGIATQDLGCPDDTILGTVSLDPSQVRRQT